MNFSSPEKVDEVVKKMKESSYDGDRNMALVNGIFNGDPLLSTAECKKQKVQINVPSMKCPEIMDNARGQWDTAMTSRDKYFRCSCLEGPPEERPDYGFKFTRNLALIMKRSKDFLNTVNELGASVMLHGRGPLMWENDEKWAPDMIGLGDLKIPGRVLTSFKNLGYLAVYRRPTPFMLYDSAFGETPDKRWNKSLVKQILAKMAKVNTEGADYANWEFPAEIAEDFKSNSGYWSSDVQPTVNYWDFFYRDDEKKTWHRKAILDRENPSLGIEIKTNDWLYDGGDDDYAPDLNQILQVIFANGCHVAPFRYHSVRGLGYRLYEDGRYEARARNRFRETVLSEMLMLFYSLGSDGREPPEAIWLSHMGMMPPGAQMVPAKDRYRPDLNFIMAGLNETRQSMSEQSTSYTMDLEGGEESDRETATRTMARMQTANAMVGNFLVKAYEQWKHVGREIVRRFLRPNSLDSDVKEFQALCLKDGIPEELMKPEYWDVEPERVAGNGNRMLAAAQADRLMLQFPRLDPQGQRIVLHMYVLANCDDPSLGDAIVPMQDKEPSSTVERAYLSIGSLMRGLQAPMLRTDNQSEYVQVLLGALGKLIENAKQTSNMVDAPTLIGLGTIAQEAKKRIELIKQDPEAKPMVKQLEDVLGKLMNELKGFAQRLQEQMAKRGQGMDPEVMGKLQAMQIMAQSQAKIKEATAAQKMRHKELQFRADQRRKDLEAGVSAMRTMKEAQVDAAATDIRTEADIRNSSRKQLAAFNDGGEE